MNKNIIKHFYHPQIVDYIEEYDRDTTELMKRIYFNNWLGSTIKRIEEFDEDTNNKIKETKYQIYWGIPESITYYDITTGKKNKETHYHKDNENIQQIDYYDENTGKRNYTEFYHLNDKTGIFIQKFNLRTGFLDNEIYILDGKTVCFVKNLK